MDSGYTLLTRIVAQKSCICRQLSGSQHKTRLSKYTRKHLPPINFTNEEALADVAYDLIAPRDTNGSYYKKGNRN